MAVNSAGNSLRAIEASGCHASSARGSRIAASIPGANSASISAVLAPAAAGGGAADCDTRMPLQITAAATINAEIRITNASVLQHRVEALAVQLVASFERD